MKRVIAAVMVLLFIGTPVLATTRQCLDNATLQKTYNYTIVISGQTETITINREEDCQFGCDNVTHNCAPDPVMLNYVFGGGILLLLFVIALIARFMRGV